MTTRISRFKKIIFLTSVLFWLSLAAFLMDAKAQTGGATLYLSPSNGTYVIGQKFNVSIKVNSGGQAINSAEGSINFNKDILEVVSISKGGSIFPFWTAEPNFSNGGGTISFGGGMPPPAYTGTAGQIITISFKAKKAGKGSVSFGSGAVLAHDGKGTNVLSSMGSGNFTVSPQVTAPTNDKEPEKDNTPAPEPISDYNRPKIVSSTHPDQNIWYNRNTALFSWELPAGISGVSVDFNQEPVSDPGPASDGVLTEKEYPDVNDGVWYLHLKFKDSQRWGTVEHYRVMIDTKPPEPFEIEVRQIGVGDWPELKYETKDSESGLLRYEIYIGPLEHQVYDKKPEETTIKIEGLSSGEHTALVKAIDKAGNERVETVIFRIEPIPAPVISNYPKEMKSSDSLYLAGTSLAGTKVTLSIQLGSSLIATSTVKADENGNWFYLSGEKLENGRYVAWAEAMNEKGIKSASSETVSFMVTPPVFAVIGDFVINYFTVFVSLVFMIILIILSILYIVGLIRRRLKKETYEVEEVLHKNSLEIKNVIEKELNAVAAVGHSQSVKDGMEKAKERLKARIDINEKKTLKEIRDIEDILR